MIKYEWRTELDVDEFNELSDLLARAAEYDAEPEYTTISAAEVAQSMSSGDGRARHLLIWMLPYATAQGEPDQPERIAGLMRLVVDARGVGRAAVVVDPRFRSIGIMTLLLERVGLDCSADGGWLGTGAVEITSWAQGNHPAAGRISNRFLIPRTRRVWKLIRATDSPESSTAAPVLEQISSEALREAAWASELDGPFGHVLRVDGRVVGAATLSFDAAYSEDFGRCATVTGFHSAPSATARERRGLLEGLAALAHEADLTGLIVYVDSDDGEWVNACRLTGFQHDRTDVRFQLGGRA